MAVGAPGAENYGHASRKALKCIASKGFFTIVIKTNNRAFDASTSTVSEVLQGLSAISSLGRVDVVDSENRVDPSALPLLFCNESAPTAFIFRISSPNIKETLTSIQKIFADVAPLYFPKLSTNSVTPASVEITDVQLAQGLDNFQTGAIYMFKRNNLGVWNEEFKIMPSVVMLEMNLVEK